MVLQACAWQKIPAAPSYAPAPSLPITVGVEVSTSTDSGHYGPVVVNLLSQMSVVDKLVFPYREGDVVDALLGIEVDGSWKRRGTGAGLVIGLTLGLASPVVGPSMTGTHQLNATLTDENNPITFGQRPASPMIKTPIGASGLPRLLYGPPLASFFRKANTPLHLLPNGR